MNSGTLYFCTTLSLFIHLLKAVYIGAISWLLWRGSYEHCKVSVCWVECWSYSYVQEWYNWIIGQIYFCFVRIVNRISKVTASPPLVNQGFFFSTTLPAFVVSYFVDLGYSDLGKLNSQIFISITVIRCWTDIEVFLDHFQFFFLENFLLRYLCPFILAMFPWLCIFFF